MHVMWTPSLGSAATSKAVLVKCMLIGQPIGSASETRSGVHISVAWRNLRQPFTLLAALIFLQHSSSSLVSSVNRQFVEQRDLNDACCGVQRTHLLLPFA